MTTQKIETLMTYFAHQVAGPSRMLWGLYVRQAYVDGGEYLAGALLLGVIAGILWRRNPYSFFDLGDDLAILYYLGLFVAAGVGILLLFTAIRFLGNPGYQAVQMLVNNL